MTTRTAAALLGASLLPAALLPAALPAPAQDEKSGEAPPEHEIVEGQPMITVLPPDAIPAVDDPVFVSAAEAESFLLPDEPVLGVVGADGTAKAYSAWHLDHHEIVNDELDGEPIAATW